MLQSWPRPIFLKKKTYDDRVPVRLAQYCCHLSSVNRYIWTNPPKQKEAAASASFDGSSS